MLSADNSTQSSRPEVMLFQRPIFIAAKIAKLCEYYVRILEYLSLCAEILSKI